MALGVMGAQRRLRVSLLTINCRPAAWIVCCMHLCGHENSPCAIVSTPRLRAFHPPLTLLPMPPPHNNTAPLSHAASTSATPQVCGNTSVFCPSGAVDPAPVPIGWYSTPDDGSVDGTTRHGMAQCVPGEFCVAGVRAVCPGEGNCCMRKQFNASLGPTSPLTPHV